MILLEVLPDLYLDLYFRRHRVRSDWRRAPFIWWLPGIVVLAYTVGLASVKSFIPANFAWIEIYLFLVGLFVIPKAVFAGCSFLGALWSHWRHTHVNRGNRWGMVLGGLSMLMFFYGLTLGPRKLKVTRVQLFLPDLPKSFEGYRIVQFSDAHVGTFYRYMDRTLTRDVDSILAQKPDLICFTGDLVDTRATEIYPFLSVLQRLKRESGVPVYSILGNHDYSMYIAGSPAEKRANELHLQRLERQLGWRLLMNEHEVIRRGRDSLVIAGEENEGSRKFPKKSDLKKTLQSVDPHSLVIMLQHDPTAWDDSILPFSHVQLTLSGHTHAGQVNLFGLRPTRAVYREDYGLYERGGRYLYVSAGLGGLVPFRLGATPDIVVITLHRRYPGM